MSQIGYMWVVNSSSSRYTEVTNITSKTDWKFTKKSASLDGCPGKSQA